MRKWNDHTFLFPFLYSNMMFTRCEIGRADVLLRWSSPAESNSHFMDEGFICKSSLPCHFQDCLSTGESYFQISQRQPASLFFYYYFLGVGGLQIFCCRLSWLYAIFFIRKRPWVKLAVLPEQTPTEFHAGTLLRQISGLRFSVALSLRFPDADPVGGVEKSGSPPGSRKRI